MLNAFYNLVQNGCGLQCWSNNEELKLEEPAAITKSDRMPKLTTGTIKIETVREKKTKLSQTKAQLL